MKKISFLSIVTLMIFFQNISIASASEVEMSNNDFTRLVCGYLQRMDNKPKALNKIKAMTESKINAIQLAKLEEIATSKQATEDFCRSSRPRL